MYYNPYIVIPFATWLIAQTLKFALAAFRGRVDFKYLYASGGMPSVHSAVVCSLAVTAFLVDGGASHLFGFSLLFAAIVMYDSFGVRRAAGEQAIALNMIVQSLEKDRIKLENPDIKLREVLGHTPAQVGVGAFLGVALGLLFNLSYLTKQIEFLTALPSKTETIVYAAIFGVIIVAGWVVAIVLGSRYKKSKIMAEVSRAELTATQTIGWLGIVVAFGMFQHLPYLSYRVWAWLLLGIFIIWKIYLISKYWKTVPAELAKEREERRKKKWFQRPKKKK